MLALAGPERAERLLAPMRNFGRPLVDLVKNCPYTRLQSMVDATVPHGWHYYWKSAGLRTLGNDVIETMVDHAARISSPWSYAVMFHLGGAVAEVDSDATAYTRRDISHELNINAVWLPHEPIGDTETAWAKTFFANLEPSHAGAYLNFLDRDDDARTPEAFDSAAYARLLELQGRFDPDRVLQPHPKLAPIRGRA
ncbi:hypothetical protein BH18ACT15_BH18ACT15_01080 [soil metagenome]